MNAVDRTSHIDVAAVRPSLDELIKRASDFVPILQEKARETEDNRRVSSEIMQQLADADLLKLMKPARFGGFEYGPTSLVRAGFELGRGCGSTAWCAMIANVDNWFASYWPLEAQDEIWGKQPGALIAATVMPTGKCEPFGDGYKIWGRWPFASNCDNSSWFSVSAMLPGDDGVGWFMIPGSDIKIDHASWEVAGLQGSGSKTVYVEDPVFVPPHRVVRYNDVVKGSFPGASIENNPMSRYLFSTFGACALIGQMLGMAQGALDWFTKAMAEKLRVAMRPGAPMNAAQNPFIQERAGRASADIDAGLAFLLAEIGELEKLVEAGAMLTTDQRVRARRAVGFAARQAVAAIETLMGGAGASAADLDVPIQRYWRDINMAARHVTMDVQGINLMVGQTLFGMQPTGSF